MSDVTVTDVPHLPRLNLYSHKSKLAEADKREMAVLAALELIRAAALAGKPLSTEIGHLSDYADKIQKALEVVES